MKLRYLTQHEKNVILMKTLSLLVGIVAIMSLVFAAPWPGDAGVDIHQNLPAGYEPSGVVWHPHYNALFLVSDGGMLSKMNLDGSQVTTWNVPGDLEGVTITDPNSEFVYLAVEYPFALIKFNPATGQANRTLSLTGVVPATANTNSGIEGVTFVPNGSHPYANSANGGLFYIGVQENGVVYAVDVDFNAGTARLVGSFTPVAGRTDIAGLYFNAQTNVLYVDYDAANFLREIRTNNTFVQEYVLPGLDQEGVAVITSCPNAQATVVIAEDSGRVMKYQNYPVVCPVVYVDADNDGFNSNVDCNDNNAQVNPGHAEVLYNGVDDDCNAATLDVLSWPAGAGVRISQNLPAGYEPSGVVWHPYYNALFVVSDNGAISRLNLNGSNPVTWNVPGDLEGITITDSSAVFVYSAVEYPYALIKFNPLTGQVVRSVSLTGVVPATVNTNAGISGLTFVPNGHHPYADSPNGGLFYVGLEENGNVHAIDVDFDAGTARLVSSFTPVPGRVDIEGLNYNRETRTLSILYDTVNLIREINLDNSLVAEYVVAGGVTEGLTILPSCPSPTATIVIAEDTGPVTVYAGYPVVCVIPDADNDGFNSNVDCNDNNALVNPGMSEFLYDGIDNDCNVATPDTVDADGDLYHSNVDCNDNNSQVNPGMSEILYNGVNDDCNANTLDTVDSDADGFNSNVDCNDNSAQVNPGHVEVLRNGVDDDCNVQTLDVPPSVIMEAEQMPTLSGSNVRRLADSVAFYTNGYAQGTQYLEQGTYTIRFYSRADLVAGRTANLRVTLDGMVVGNFAINSTVFVERLIVRNMTQGNHTVRVQFTNDYYRTNPTRDVNLYVDKVIFER